MRTVTLEELLEAGCHFGHQVTRQNPRARDYIFEERDGIHIIDLEKTKEGLEEAGAFIKEVAKRGGTLLVLGTKRQAEEVLRGEMDRLRDAGIEGVYFVLKRWIGGTFTNFSEVSKNFKKLQELSRKLGDGHAKAGYTKKEILDWEKERQKLFAFYGGIEGMKKLPDSIFIIDTHIEDLAVQEAIKMKVKVVGITDTNADPMLVEHPIPANDDAVGSLKLIADYIIDAWMEGRKVVKVPEVEVLKEKGEKKKEEKQDKVKKSVGEGEEPKKNEEKKVSKVSKVVKKTKSKEKVLV